MKHSTKTNEDGSVTLILGTHKAADFSVGSTPEVIVSGVDSLIKEVVGVSAFDLAGAVLSEFNKDG